MTDLNWQFESWQAFWQMAGHGPYVWAAMAITALVMAVLVLVPLRRRKQLLNEIRKEQLRARRRSQAGYSG